MNRREFLSALSAIPLAALLPARFTKAFAPKPKQLPNCVRLTITGITWMDAKALEGGIYRATITYSLKAEYVGRQVVAINVDEIGGEKQHRLPVNSEHFARLFHVQEGGELVFTFNAPRPWQLKGAP